MRFFSHFLAILGLLSCVNSLPNILEQISLDFEENISEDFSYSAHGRLEILYADHFEEKTSKKIFLLHSSTSDRKYHVEFSSPLHRHRFERHLLPHSHFVIRGNLLHNETRPHLWDDNFRVLSLTSLEALPSSDEFEDREFEFSDVESVGGRYFTSFGGLKGREKREKREKRGNVRGIQQKSIAFLVLNFKDTNVPCNMDTIAQGLYKVNYAVTKTFTTESFGTVSIASAISKPGSGFDLYGPFNIDATAKSGGCAGQLWADRAEEAATKAGIDLGDYYYRVFVIPPETGKICQWQGLGTVGPGCWQACRAWVNTCDRAEIFVHELGHNVGMTHAGTDFGEKGFNVEYGDVTDYMGNSIYKPGEHEMIFNPAKRDEASWFDNDKTSRYQLIKFDGNKNQNYYFTKDQIDGSYYISPTNAEVPEYPIGIRIWMQESNQHYFIHYETQATPWSYQGIVLSYTNGINSRVLKLLKLGDSFVDKLGRFSFIVSSLDSRRMLVKIDWGCTYSASGVVFKQIFSDGNESPLSSTSPIFVSNGKNTIVKFNISNNDSPLCPSVYYNLKTPDLPPDVSVTFNPSSLFLMGNQNCEITATFTTNSMGASSYPYTIQLNGTNTAGDSLSNHSLQLSGVISVSQGCHRSVPTLFTNSTQGVIGRGSNFYLGYSFQDHSSLECPATDYLISFRVSNGLSGSIGKQRVTLSPGQTSQQDVFIITSPNSGFSNISEIILTVTSAINVTLYSPNADPGDKFRSNSGPLTTSSSLVLSSGDPCGLVSPIIILDSNITTNAKSAVAVNLEISNLDTLNCPSSSFLLYTDEPSITFSPNPVVIPPGFSFASVLIVNSKQTDQFASNLTIKITDTIFPNRPIQDIPFSLVVNAVSCEPHVPTFDKDFPSEFDPSVGIFSMWFQAVNYDVWSCPDTNFQMNAVFENGLTWTSMIEQYGNTAPILLYPGNYTSRVYINVTIPPNPSFDVIRASFALVDPNLASHSNNFSVSVPINKCIRTAPNVTILNSNFTYYLYQGETASFTVQLINNDPKSCDWLHIFDGIKETSVFSASSYDPNSFVLGIFPSAIVTNSGTIKTFNGKLTVSNEFPPFNTTQNTTVTITLKDKENANHTVSLNVTIFILPGCIKNTPLVTLDPSALNISIKTGASQRVPILFNVTNMDEGPLCNGTQYGLTGGIPSPSGGWDLLSGGDSAYFYLPYNTTVNQSIIAITRENLRAGSTNLVTVGVFENSDQIVHISTVQVKISTSCPLPSAPRNLIASSSLPAHSFLLQTKPNFISWDGCTTPSECCCPCTFVISRNGVEIGRTQLRNFTDSRNLKGGKSYLYSVSVIDAKGVRSPTAVCGNTITAKAESPPIATILIYLVVSVICLLAFLGLLYGIYLLIERYVGRPPPPPSLRRSSVGDNRSFSTKAKEKFSEIWSRINQFFGRNPPETQTVETDLPSVELGDTN